MCGFLIPFRVLLHSRVSLLITVVAGCKMASSSTGDLEIACSSSNSMEEATTTVKDNTASFFTSGTCKQFEFVLAKYPQVLKLKAEKRCKRPDELVRLDDW